MTDSEHQLRDQIGRLQRRLADEEQATAQLNAENKHLSNKLFQRDDELVRALRTMSTAVEISAAIGSDTDLSRILQLIVERARSLVQADGLIVWLRDEGNIRVAATSSDPAARLNMASTTEPALAQQVLQTLVSARSDATQCLTLDPADFGIADARSALMVPLVYRGKALGLMMAFQCLYESPLFDEDSQRALEAFAAGASTAVATARLVERQRLHDSMAAAEAERGRWARELHDETLQGLASLKIALAAALRTVPEDAAQTRSVLEHSIVGLARDIQALRLIIADLRPAALDELGLEPALRTLIARVSADSGLRIRTSFLLGNTRLHSNLETIAYRVAQEALTNAVRHANARTVDVALSLSGENLQLEVADDGRGYQKDSQQGYGIVGMRERAEQASGQLRVTEAFAGGTVVSLQLPLG